MPGLSYASPVVSWSRPIHWRAMSTVPIFSPDAACAAPIPVKRPGTPRQWLPQMPQMPQWRGGAVGAVAVPLIERIRSVSTFATPSTWQVDTDRGATELVLKVEEDIRRLPGAKRLLITSGSGVVFEIRDRHRLDRTSQRLLERFL